MFFLKTRGVIGYRLAISVWLKRFRVFISVLIINVTMMQLAWGAIVLGNPTGKVTLIAVVDYQCPHCHQLYPVLTRLIAHQPQLKVRLMPVAIVNKASSLYAATAAIAMAHEGDKFKRFTQVVMTAPRLSMSATTQLLDQLQLATPNFLHTLHQPWVKGQLMEGLTWLRNTHAGTPLLVFYRTNHPIDSSKLAHTKSAQILRGYHTYAALEGVMTKMLLSERHHG